MIRWRDRAKQAIGRIHDAVDCPHLDITEFASLAATELKSQKDNIKKIERQKFREIALLSLERYVATVRFGHCIHRRFGRGGMGRNGR